MTHLPWIEIYLPPQARSFDDQMRIRLLKDKSKYAVCPYKSDLSVTGLRTALQELDLYPKPDPHLPLKARLSQDFFDRFYS